MEPISTALILHRSAFSQTAYRAFEIEHKFVGLAEQPSRARRATAPITKTMAPTTKAPMRVGFAFLLTRPLLSASKKFSHLGVLTMG